MVGHIGTSTSTSNRYAALAEDDQDSGVVNSVGDASNHYKRELIIDSGAAESVIPRDFLRGPWSANETNKNGKTFIAANGSTMRSFGEDEVEAPYPRKSRK